MSRSTGTIGAEFACGSEQTFDPIVGMSIFAMPPPAPFNLMSRTFAVLFVALGVIASCAEGTRPFTLVAVCLEDQQDVSEFLTELREEAERSGMTFTDGSDQTARDLVALNERRPGEFVMNVGVEHPHGYGLLAGDMHSGYQVAVGFNGDAASRDSAEARAWADAVVARLRERWRVEAVPNPSESGAFPMSGCSSG
jgi:hypothetical protein